MKTTWGGVAQVYDTRMRELYGQYDPVEVELIGSLRNKRIFDIGCGTGWVLDRFPGIRPENYLGCDPSSRMLRQLARKHPAFLPVTHHATFRQFYANGLIWEGTFDVVLAVGGVGTYLDTEDVAATIGLLSPSGRFIMSVYANRTKQPMFPDWGIRESYAAMPDQIRDREPDLIADFDHIHILRREAAK